MAPGPLYFFIQNNPEVKNRLLLKKENVKSWYCENNLWKLQLLTIFAKHSIVDVWKGFEYASVFNFKYIMDTRVLNMVGLRRFWICLYNFWTCLNMPKCVWIYLNLTEWLLFYLFPHCNPVYLNVWLLIQMFIWN